MGRSVLLSEIELVNPRFPVSVRVQPARWIGPGRGQDGCRAVPTPDPTDHVFRDGDPALVQVSLDGHESAYVSIVVTSADMVSRQIFPMASDPWHTPQTGVVFEECVTVSRGPAAPRPGLRPPVGQPRYYTESPSSDSA